MKINYKNEELKLKIYPTKKVWLCLLHCGASLVAQRVKHLPAMRETHVRSLGQEYSLEKEMAIHSSILAWRIQWTEEPGRLQFTVHTHTYISSHTQPVFNLWVNNLCVLPAIQDTQVQSLGQKDPLEKGMVTHFPILSMDRGSWWSIASQRVKCDWHTHNNYRIKWNQKWCPVVT